MLSCSGHAGADHNVCWREPESAKDQQHQDGGLLASLQSPHPFCGGFDPHLRGGLFCSLRKSEIISSRTH